MKLTSAVFLRNRKSDVHKVLKCVRHGCLVNPKVYCFRIGGSKGIFLGVQTGGSKIMKSIENSVVIYL